MVACNPILPEPKMSWMRKAALRIGWPWTLSAGHMEAPVWFSKPSAYVPPHESAGASPLALRTRVRGRTCEVVRAGHDRWSGGDHREAGKLMRLVRGASKESRSPCSPARSEILVKRLQLGSVTNQTSCVSSPCSSNLRPARPEWPCTSWSPRAPCVWPLWDLPGMLQRRLRTSFLHCSVQIPDFLLVRMFNIENFYLHLL